MSETLPLPQTDGIDTLLSLPADGERRATLTHLQETPRAAASLEELVTALATHTGRDPEQARTRLHHNHLPKLADTTILVYDTDANAVWYDDPPELESLLEIIQTIEL